MTRSVKGKPSRTGPGAAGDRPAKERADKLVVDRGLAPSRERARALIVAGSVLAGDHAIEKPGTLLPVDVELRLRGADIPYVSRGGLKLAHALEHFALAGSVAGAICLDVGASTGGFTDCLLQRGAAGVYAVDVGYGQLAWKLRQDARVYVIERQNIRYLDASAFAERPTLATIDVSFISLTLVLPKVAEILGPERKVVALIKPQFELERRDIGKGGVVREPERRAAAVTKIADFARAAGWRLQGVTESPILGPAGNVEFLMLLFTPPC